MGVKWEIKAFPLRKVCGVLYVEKAGAGRAIFEVYKAMVYISHIIISLRRFYTPFTLATFYFKKNNLGVSGI